MRPSTVQLVFLKPTIVLVAAGLSKSRPCLGARRYTRNMRSSLQRPTQDAQNPKNANTENKPDKNNYLSAKKRSFIVLPQVLFVLFRHRKPEWTRRKCMFPPSKLDPKTRSTAGLLICFSCKRPKGALFPSGFARDGRLAR